MKIFEVLDSKYINRIVCDSILCTSWIITEDDLVWVEDGCSIIYFYDLKTLINMRFKFIDQ